VIARPVGTIAVGVSTDPIPSKPGPAIVAVRATAATGAVLDDVLGETTIVAVCVSFAIVFEPRTVASAVAVVVSPAFRKDVEFAAVTASASVTVIVQVRAAVLRAAPAGVTRTTYVPATFGVIPSVAARVERPAAAAPTERTREATPEPAELFTVVTVDVSVSVSVFVAVEGALRSTAVAVIVSPTAPASWVTVNTFVTATPTVVDDVADVKVVESAAADDGATATRLRPKAATATSAMRLKVVFVDMCFLSIVDLENFPSPA
jgi:hypothetical protein